MSVKLVSYLHYKEQEPIDISFLDGFYDKSDKAIIYRIRQWIAVFIYDLKLPVKDFNRGAQLVKRFNELKNDPRMHLLYTKINVNEVLDAAPYLREPLRKGDDLSIPTVEISGRGSYCTFETNPRLRKKGNTHRRTFLDLSTIALFSKTIQPKETVDLTKLDSHFYTVLRASHIHEHSHTIQTHLEEVYDWVRDRYLRNTSMYEWDSVEYFSRVLAYDVTAWDWAVNDRIKLDNGESENTKLLRDLSLLELTHAIIIAITDILQYKKLNLYEFSFNITNSLL